MLGSAELEHGIRFRMRGIVWRDPSAIEQDRSPRTGDSEPGISAEPQTQPTEGDLDAGGTLGISDEAIGEADGASVERTRRPHAEVGVARTPEILHQAEWAGLDDGDRPRHGTASKRTVPPGTRRAGDAASEFQSTASVVPMSCQPPGLLRG